MKRNSVKVCIRTRPTQYFAQDNIFIDEEHGTVQINTSVLADETPGLLNNKQSNFKFKFDHVFHNATQASVYDLYARDTVQGVVDGINGSVMSYGQTGSGKTFTMMGDAQSYEHRGIAPRAINQLFNEINSRIEFEFKITCTYMEIYNERIFDLLNDLSSPDQAADYTIAEEKDGRGTFVRGLAEIEVKDENSTLNLLFSGGLSRTIATHKLNKRSNRSHSIFTVYLQQRQRSGVSEKVVHSKLHLVDLAGSERLKKTMDSIDGTIGDEVTRKESMAINQSLTYLEQCVVALSRRGQGHIPYRQSKLTNILKDTLGANCNTVMLACVWGEASHLEETVSTLRLASRMMRVQNETVSVQTVDPNALIKKQEKIIRALKQELLMHDALIERTGVAYDPYTPEQQDAVAQMLEQYVDASELEEEGVLNISNYRQMIEICKQFKRKLLTARSETKQAREQAYLGSASGRMGGGRLSGDGGNGLGLIGGNSSSEDRLAEEFDPRAPTVGEPTAALRGLGQGRGGFSLGVSTSESRPPGGVEGLSRFDPTQGPTSQGARAVNFNSPAGDGPLNQQPFSPAGGGGSFGFGDYSPTKSPDMDTDGLGLGGGELNRFEAYARSDDVGKQLYKDFTECRSTAREAKLRSKDLAVTVNRAKEIIDRLLQDIEARKASRIEHQRKMPGKDKEAMVDEEEFRLAAELKDAKKAYKSCFEQMQQSKGVAMEAQAKANSLKAALASGFSKWKGGGEGGTRASMGKGSAPMAVSMPTRKGEESSYLGGGGGGGGGFSGDQLDDQEAFDKLEIERVLANDPESLAFFHAQKTRRANITQNGGSLRQMQRNKRLG